MSSEGSVTKILDSAGVNLLFKAILAAGVPFAIWVGSTITATHDAVVQLQTQMTERTQDRYSATDARHDRSEYLLLIQQNESNLKNLSDRLGNDENVVFNRPTRGNGR